MERFNSAKRASIFGILGNIFLFIIKIIVALISHSEAMLADAINSASDIFNSFMTYIGNKISSKEADDDHQLGHGKAEYIFSLLISITMLVLGLKILLDSSLSIFNHQTYHFTYWLIIVCITTITTKAILYIYTNKVSKKYNNLLIEANSKDHRNDCIITSFNLLSCILSIYKLYIVDSIVGIGISLWIIYTSVSIFKESYDVLMDKSMNKETKDKILKIVSNYPEIKKTSHFNSTPVGYMYQISISIFVDGNLSTFRSHEIANKLEKEIIAKIPEVYLAVIHVNPMDLKAE